MDSCESFDFIFSNVSAQAIIDGSRTSWQLLDLKAQLSADKED